MELSLFEERAIAQDKRNVFSPYEDDLSFVPKDLVTFYSMHNPVDVEVGYNGSSIRFIPAKNLESENEEYRDLKVGFVFATCDGDPIFVKGGKVYTCPHGVNEPDWEKLASSYKDYLSLIIED